MKKFAKAVLYYILLLVLLIVVLTVVLPVTPRTKNSYFQGINQKDYLLANVPSPRIIFVGGSNLAFGLNSQIIKDSLGYNPINMGLHASLGLEFMLQSSLDGVRKNDIVVVIPEYGQLHSDAAYGDQALLITTLCEKNENISKLSWHQWTKILQYVPKYAFSKLSIYEYLPDKTLGSYNSRTFNTYGDVKSRWAGGFKFVEPYKSPKSPFNSDMMNKLVAYRAEVIRRGASLYIGCPAFQKRSFENAKNTIAEECDSLLRRGFILISSPQKYIVNDSALYDTPYHLSLKAADIRTKLLVADLKKVLRKTN